MVVFRWAVNSSEIKASNMWAAGELALAGEPADLKNAAIPTPCVVSMFGESAEACFRGEGIACRKD
jgi:hypothetical protein